jgi:pyruvate-formate lyase-activating enzyme
VIPGATDGPDNIRGIGRLIADELAGAVQRWELCAFNPLGAEKYRRLGIAWRYDEADLISNDAMARLRTEGEEAVDGTVPVLATGLTGGEY